MPEFAVHSSPLIKSLVVLNTARCWAKKPYMAQYVVSPIRRRHFVNGLIGTRMPSPLIHKGFVFVAVPTAIRERVSRTVIDAVASPMSDTALASLGSGTCAAVPFETCALVVRVYLCQ